MQLLTQIIRLLLTMVPEQRTVSLREDSPPYPAHSDPADWEPLDREALTELLNSAPLP
jgi:hypothetical protein